MIFVRNIIMIPDIYDIYTLDDLDEVEYSFNQFNGKDISADFIKVFNIWQTPPHIKEPLIEIRETIKDFPARIFVNLAGEILQGFLPDNDLEKLRLWIKENKEDIVKYFYNHIEEINEVRRTSY